MWVFDMLQAAEQHSMDPALAKKRTKKRKAPVPPNPFTGEVDESRKNPFDEDEEDIEVETDEVS